MRGSRPRFIAAPFTSPSYSRVLDHREPLQSPALVLAFAEFWFRALLAIDWWHQQANVRRLLDCICQLVFFVHGGRGMVQQHLKAQYLRMQQQQGTRSTGFMASVKSMFAAASEPVVVLSISESGFSFAWLMHYVRGMTAPPTAVWLAFECLCLETAAELERRTVIGNFLTQASNYRVEDALKRCKLSGVDQLTIFRWIYFMNNLPNDCTLLPLFWQVFFSLLFANVSFPAAGRGGGPTRRAYGPQMLGSGRVEILAALERRANELIEYFRDRVSQPDSQTKAIDQPQLQLYSLAKLWLLSEHLRKLEKQEKRP